MHVPDHFLDPATSVATAVVAGAVLITAARRLRNTPTGPAAFAWTTAAVFGLQMLNYPIASGTSGHLLGGALAAAILGPLWGMVSITVVLVVQCLMFADGGVTALGTNVLLMAIVGTLTGWGVAHGVLVLRERSRWAAGRAAGTAMTAAAAGLGGLVSVLAAAAAFTVLFALGGTVEVPLSALAAEMLGVHAIIGIGEGLITAALVGGVALAAPGSLALSGARLQAGPVRSIGFGAGLAGGVARAERRAMIVLGSVAVGAAGGLSWAASPSPDGLAATAASLGFAGAARDHALAGFPLAGYGETGGLLIGLAGLIGIALCVGAARGAARVIRPAQVPAG